MKRALLYAVIAASFLFSCKKDQKKPVTSVSIKYPVSFNASDFSQTVITSSPGALKVNGLTTNAVANIESYSDLFYYFVFDSTGKQVSLIRQNSADSNFGVIADSLASGNYTVVMAAGKNNLTYSNDPQLGLDVRTPILSDKYFYFSDINTTDIFFKNFALTVSGTPVSQNIVLNRIVGNLEVKILDAIPANASSIDIIINGDYYRYDFSERTPGDPTQSGSAGRLISTTIPAAVKGTTNYKLDNLVLNTYYPFTVTIICYDAAKTVLVKTTIPNVVCQKNVKTILSGNLFGSGGSTVPVTVHSTWTVNSISF